jgi:hypothetical protein
MTTLKQAAKIGEKKNSEIVKGCVKTLENMVQYYNTYKGIVDELEIRVECVIDQICDEIYISACLIEDERELDRYHEDFVIGGPGKTKIIAEDLAAALKAKKIDANFKRVIFN